VKRIPEHIVPKFDDAITKYGMFNTRLNQWVGKDPDFGHPFFDSPQEAREWYRTQI
jgi:hypothetical protein